MSVYIKENPLFLEQSLTSILINQSLPPNEVVLVKDGLLSPELDAVILDFQEKYPECMKVIELESNHGLGNALNIGLQHCTYDIVARMDSDDICVGNRFEIQIDQFKMKPDLAVLGGWIAEFYESSSSLTSIKKLPNDIKKIKAMIKRRNPINHMTVMFRKSAVLAVGGYKHLPYLEDYYLWIRVVGRGFLVENLNEVLVYARTGHDFYVRRSNFVYINGWFFLQREMRNMRLINNIDRIYNMISIVVFIYTPPKMKRIIYSRLLRNSNL